MSYRKQGGRHELTRPHVRRELRESQRQNARLEAADKADLAVLTWIFCAISMFQRITIRKATRLDVACAPWRRTESVA
jgi:hypothetical protein